MWGRVKSIESGIVPGLDLGFVVTVVTTNEQWASGSSSAICLVWDHFVRGISSVWNLP